MLDCWQMQVNKTVACDWRDARAASGEPEAETANQAENEAGGNLVLGTENLNSKGL